MRVTATNCAGVSASDEIQLGPFSSSDQNNNSQCIAFVIATAVLASLLVLTIVTVLVVATIVGVSLRQRANKKKGIVNYANHVTVTIILSYWQ